MVDFGKLNYLFIIEAKMLLISEVVYFFKKDLVCNFWVSE